jgi:hypothetical protein
MHQASGWAGELIGAEVRQDADGWRVTLQFEKGVVDFVAAAVP